MESEWAMFKASIDKAAAQSCGQKVINACRSGSLRALLVDTRGEGGHQVDEGGLLDLVGPGVS